MPNTIRLLAALGVAATLAACGTTPVERAATGAAGGAAAAIVLGEEDFVTEGAILGAAAGGLGGCVVNPNAQGCY
jgi:hypothetical protein